MVATSTALGKVARRVGRGHQRPPPRGSRSENREKKATNTAEKGADSLKGPPPLATGLGASCARVLGRQPARAARQAWVALPTALGSATSREVILRKAIVPCLALPLLVGCLEIEQAVICNRVGSKIHATFANPQRVHSIEELEALRRQVHDLASSLEAELPRVTAARQELSLVRQELGSLEAELKRAAAAPPGPSRVSLHKRLTDGFQRLADSVDRLRAACQPRS